MDCQLSKDTSVAVHTETTDVLMCRGLGSFISSDSETQLSKWGEGRGKQA